MKKHSKILLLILAISLVTGCTKKGNKDTRVYTLNGEDNFMSLDGGVLVLDDKKDTFKGGKIYIKNSDYPKLKYYTISYYYLRDNSKQLLMSNTYDLKQGEPESIDGKLTGGISSGNMFENTNIDDIKDNFFITIDGIDEKEREAYYSIQLNLELIHPNDNEE